MTQDQTVSYLPRNPVTYTTVRKAIWFAIHAPRPWWQRAMSEGIGYAGMIAALVALLISQWG